MDADKAYVYANALSDLISELRAEENRTRTGNPPHGPFDQVTARWERVMDAWDDLEATLKPDE